MLVALAKKPALPLVLLAGIALALDIGVVLSMTTTYDERAHLDYGYRTLCIHPDRVSILDDSKMPISALNAAGGQRSHPHS
jgi:hypothetical protein